MDREVFVGTWEVVGFKYTNSTFKEVLGLEGVKFRLDETGDVFWYYDKKLENAALFLCDTYEIYNHGAIPEEYGILRFGAYAGQVFEFRCDDIQHHETMTLLFENWCILNCIWVKNGFVDTHCNIPFTLLPALDEGYFSDLVVISDNDKAFSVHSIILQLHCANEILFDDATNPFNGLPENVLCTILHYMYTECLPNNLDVETAKSIIDFVIGYPSLTRLEELCQKLIANTTLKEQILGLVNDMHTTLQLVIDRFGSDECQNIDVTLNGPELLCNILKQSIQDLIVVAVKFVLFCVYFNKKKTDLSRDERHNIIRYARQRCPIFFNQMQKLFLALKSSLGSLNNIERQIVAAYLVPEIEAFLEVGSALLHELETILQDIIPNLYPMNIDASCALGKSLGMLIYYKEISKAGKLKDHVSRTLSHLLHRKDRFKEMAPAQKIRSVTRNLEQLIEDLPHFLQVPDEIIVSEKLDWAEFKFMFKVGTSKVAALIEKIQVYRIPLLNILMHLCDLIERDVFSQALYNLDILPLSPETDAQKTNAATNKPPLTTASSSTEFQLSQSSFNNLYLIQSVCTSPTTDLSIIADYLLDMLRNGIGTDMEFEIITVKLAAEPEDANSNLNGIEEERCIVLAHRIIVAARCDWFRRALMSGMKEDIDRKIIIHDTTANLFIIFLEYLYCGRLSPDLSIDELSELLLLSDRYQLDTLKTTCEWTLQKFLDYDSVLYLLSLSDQYNAQVLKNATMNFLSNHKDLTKTDLFDELPAALQTEIFDAFPIWGARNSYSLDEPWSGGQFADQMAHLHISKKGQSSQVVAEEGSQEDGDRLSECVSQMRDILGEDPAHDKLVQIILAADYDISRAINYYYGNNGENSLK